MPWFALCLPLCFMFCISGFKPVTNPLNLLRSIRSNPLVRCCSMSSEDVIANAAVVRERIVTACQEAHRHPDSVQLVAVSKTKPIALIQALYDAGQRQFGENYYQELAEKAPCLPNDIQWHFIGHLQSSKASKLLKDVPGLSCVQSVDSEKLAAKLDSAASGRSVPLQVMIQVHTSEEDTKSGVSTEEAVALAAFITTKCAHLRLAGLMTIGAPGDLTCFDLLAQCKEHVTKELHLEQELLLSMGMSGDFEQAIARGANVVRVGSTIFGERIYKK